MSFSLATLSACAIAYLLLLFLVAYGTERRWLPPAVVRHPMVYTLSLCSYATMWSYYGSVGFAHRFGLGFATIYIGVTLAFILTPVLLMPLLRLTRTHQLTSMADVFAFRFDSQLAGVIVTLMMLGGSLPYIALQIRAVAESTQVLSRDPSPEPIAVGFCIMVSVFAIIFGARHITPRDKHSGLVAAIAFESVIKLVALLTVASVAVIMAFGSPAGVEHWLDTNPQALESFYAPVGGYEWINLLILAFAASFMLPRQFHMAFTENLRPSSLATASWAFPLFLLFIAAAVPLILWAGEVLQPGTVPDYYVLGIAMLSHSPLLALFAYVGGISAASAMIILATLALSSMSLNHLFLPLVPPTPGTDFYAVLRWARRGLIVAIIAAGYLFYLALERTEGLVSWGLLTFVAIAQLLPGLIGVLFWTRATRSGLIAGLLTGGLIWLVAVIMPALTAVSPLDVLGMPLPLSQGVTHYANVTFWSVSANTLAFCLVSLCTRPGEREVEAAAACRDVTTRIPRGALLARSPTQFVQRLAPVTGYAISMAEVGKALTDVGLDWNESRPERLQQLREQIERNLSGMMGPVLARMIVEERLQLDTDARSALAQNVRLIEERLERSRSRFRGLAAELDQLRRYHRQILEDLPLGVVAVTPNLRVVRWNPAIETLTGISVARAVGRQVEELDSPWGPFFQAFLDEDGNHAYKRRLRRASETRWLSLHKALIAEPGFGEAGDRLLLVEDVTELQLLEEELTHSERLASIGRLAAGVAHEIGNPVTGIACLAQELKDEAPDDATADAAWQILEQTQRINTIVQTLVGYAHAGSRESKPQPVRLAEAVEEAMRVVHLSKRARSMTFQSRVDPALEVMGDLQRLIQVFVNLLSNAVDACGDEGRVRISTRVLGGRVHVHLLDNGPGIPSHIRDKVLEPFFTTKAPGHGTGLGLPLVYNIIREHNGEFRIHARRGGRPGTEVLFTLPLAGARSERDDRRYA